MNSTIKLVGLHLQYKASEALSADTLLLLTLQLLLSDRNNTLHKLLRVALIKNK